jgi:hypothetical protein
MFTNERFKKPLSTEYNSSLNSSAITVIGNGGPGSNEIISEDLVVRFNCTPDNELLASNRVLVIKNGSRFKKQKCFFSAGKYSSSELNYQLGLVASNLERKLGGWPSSGFTFVWYLMFNQVLFNVKQMSLLQRIARLDLLEHNEPLACIFDPSFSDNSFGFRPNQNGQQAVKQIRGIIKMGRHFAVDVDLSKFFDRVDLDLLMTHLGYKVKDKRLFKLIRRCLRAGVIDNHLHSENREGGPQGVPLWPLLANIMLDPLDKELEK